MTNIKLRQKIDAFIKVIFEMYPDAKTELVYDNNFQLLIAILMSAQTTDIQVNKVNSEFFKVLKTPQDWINMWVKKIKTYINTISFFNNKSENIVKTCHKLINKYNSTPPKTIEELTSLNWVWIKTAKVFLAVTEDAPYLAVDTHVHRVLNRVWIVKTKLPLETDKMAEKILTKQDLWQLHNSLIMFWRYHCTARKPKCEICKLQKNCDYYKKIVFYKPK